MNIQKNKLNIGRARRRVQIRSALLLTLGVCFAISALRCVHMTDLPQAWGWKWSMLEMLATLACFGGGAYLGLCVLDGDHKRIVPVRNLSRAQILWLSLLGVLAVSPVSLVSDLMQALTDAVHPAAAGMPRGSGAFVQTLLKSALLAPICEEFFFRGYLLHALAPQGRLRAAAAVSLCFALVHPLDGFVPLALLGMLLCWMTLHTQSLLAPVLVHGMYNLTLILADHIGLQGLFAGWSLLNCTVRLLGCAAFAAALKRAYTARRVAGAFALWEDGRLARREIALIAAAVLLVLVAMIAGG